MKLEKINVDFSKYVMFITFIEEVVDRNMYSDQLDNAITFILHTEKPITYVTIHIRSICLKIKGYVFNKTS